MRHSAKAVDTRLAPALAATVFLVTSIGRVAAQHVDTVTAGRAYPGAWRFGVDTIDGFQVMGDSSKLTFTWTLSRTRRADGSIGAVSTLANVIYTTELDGKTLAPLRSRTRAKTDSADLTFSISGVRGWVAPQGKPRADVELPFDPKVRPFDGAGRSLLLEVLPFSDGYIAAVPSFDAYQGRIEWWQIRVVGSETLTYRGSQVPCWVIEIGTMGEGARTPHRQWISKDGRHMLQDRNMRVNPDGSSVVMRVR